MTESTVFRGGLYASARDILELIGHAREFRVKETGSPSAGWSTFEVHSKRQLVPDEESRSGGDFTYSLLARRSSTRFLLLSPFQEVVDAVLFPATRLRLLFSPRIAIADLVRDLTGEPRSFVLSRIWAAVPGEADALRTIGLFGGDIARAQIFRDSLLSVVDPFRVTLRDIVRGGDVLTCAGGGEISFLYRHEHSFHEIDNALRILTEGGYVDWGDAPV